MLRITIVIILLVFIGMCAAGIDQSEAHRYDFATSHNDANKGGFVDGAPVLFSANDDDDESELYFEYAFVPRLAQMRPLFCTRRGEGTNAVKCFYAHEGESRGDIVIVAVVPRGP